MRRKLLYLFLLNYGVATAQLSGIIAIPSSSYSTLAAALQAINQQGVSGLTVNISAGYTETAPAGGFTLSASGNSVQPLLIRKTGSGSNPLFVAGSSGSGTPGSAMQDGILRLTGADHVIIDGLDFTDNNSVSPKTMEFGIGFFKSGGGDGCQYNVIRNCVISLNAANNGSGTGSAGDGSRGIEFVNALASQHNSTMVVNAVGGTHSNNWLTGNVIRNCFTGISFSGYGDQSPYPLADRSNTIGGLSPAAGNTITNFGGSGNNSAAGIKIQQQYGVLIAGNRIQNNDGTWQSHPNTLRGIHCLNAPGADISILNNTVSVSGGGTNAQVTAIDNAAGGGGKVDVSGNLVTGCHYSTAVSGNFYGIINSASAGTLVIGANTFSNNSSASATGGVYLIYNNGQIQSSSTIELNKLGFVFSNVAGPSGPFSGIYCSGTSSLCSLNIRDNEFGNVQYAGSIGSGSLNFINLTADHQNVSVLRNKFANLNLNHAGTVYCINNTATTGSLLSVANNTLSNCYREAGGGFYFYYGSATSGGQAVHSFSSNLITGVNAGTGGSGNFYGIYNTEGNTAPYPLKTVVSNTISNISFPSATACYGLYISDAGDAGQNSGSEISGNIIEKLSGGDNLYGLYIGSPLSATYPLQVHDNSIADFNSTGATSSVYGAFLGGNNAGLSFYRNRIAALRGNGSTASVYGIYTGAATAFLVYNNLVADLHAPLSSGVNKVNGIYCSSGTNVRCYYNTIILNTSSTGTVFGTNALYAATTITLTLRNNILVNTSVPSGTVVSAVYRRSSSTLTTYSAASNNNLLYAGPTASGNVIFHNGSAAYQGLAAYQALVGPRDNASASQNISFLSGNIFSTSFLHLPSTISSAAESLGANLAGVADDIDLQTRQGNPGYAGTGLSPDAGADEVETATVPCSNSVPSLSLVRSQLCAGQSASIVVSGLTGNSGLSWWMANPSNNFGATSLFPTSASWDFVTGTLSAGQYSLYLQVNCGTVSVNSATLALQVSSVAPIQASASNGTICPGTSVLLTAQGLGNGSCTWRGPAGMISTQTVVQLSGLSAAASGVYTLYALQNNCPAPPSTIQITVAQVSVSAVANPPAICPGNASTLTVNSNGVAYSWNGSAGSNTLTVTPLSTTVYSVTVTNTANCSVTQTLQVQVINPTITANHAVVCLPTNSTQVSVNVFTPSVVQWFTSSAGGPVMATGNSMSLSVNTATTVFARADAVYSAALQSAGAPTLMVSSLMFDVLPQNNLFLNGFDLNLNSASGSTVEVWTRAGSAASGTAGSSGWLLAAQVSGTNSVQFNNPLFLNNGQLAGIYISVTGTSLVCSITTSNNIVGAGNSDLQLLSGFSGAYFSNMVPGRSLVGTLRYLVPACASAMIPVNVSVTTLPQLTLSASPATVCPGKSSVIMASGAGNYSVNGSGGAGPATVSPLSASIYTVNGYHLPGCSSTATIAVGLHTLQAITVTPVSQSICPYAVCVFTASGANSYTWSNGPNGPINSVNPGAATVYTVFGTDVNSCLNASTVQVTMRPQPNVVVQPASQTVCPGQVVTFTATGGASYTWQPGFYGGSTFSAQPFANAVFAVVGSGMNTCTNTALAFVSTEACVSLQEELTDFARYFPVPANALLHIECKFPVQRAELISLSGLRCWSGENLPANWQIDLGRFPAGLYFLLVEAGNEHFSGKVLVAH